MLYLKQNCILFIFKSQIIKEIDLKIKIFRFICISSKHLAFSGHVNRIMLFVAPSTEENFPFDKKYYNITMTMVKLVIIIIIIILIKNIVIIFIIVISIYLYLYIDV